MITENILNYLLQGNRLSVLECLKKFNTTELRKYIHNIRSEYHIEIKSEFVYSNNGKRYKEYWITAENIQDFKSRKSENNDN